jgi:hypothetical protein
MRLSPLLSVSWLRAGPARLACRGRAFCAAGKSARAKSSAHLRSDTPISRLKSILLFVGDDLGRAATQQASLDASRSTELLGDADTWDHHPWRARLGRRVPCLSRKSSRSIKSGISEVAQGQRAWGQPIPSSLVPSRAACMALLHPAAYLASA